ncbi:tripartite tricarboxylate transporter permease [Halomonas sp. ML-15]|uniref:tripartite tricarboxylate transporter permease n=1 Tax=Halomonas sp. ML-15 TaxID=2773305 RepID=UPI001747135C|nr:tripartite tricarboxylate transporter permease [Halomonas sp. ML-15]MBD3897626.1 tripartite tricarboxylate transporter permease [Halomonas sp. ML-15]
MLELLATSLMLILEWENLLAMVGGTILGICIGALPGLSATMGIAILIPLTFGLHPLVGLGMMAGIYNGAMYGGAIPSILLRIPGTPASVATILDGGPMSDQGRAPLALKIAVVSSAIGGIVSAVALITLAPPLSRVTLAFGPADYFWVAFFGLASIAVLVGNDPWKGIVAAAIGLLIGMVGIDTVSGAGRLTFGQSELTGGFHIVVVLIGLFGIPPTLRLAERVVRERKPTQDARLDLSQSERVPYRLLWPTWLRSSLIGVVVGILPGAGGNMASFMSYNEAKRASKTPERFGHGAEEGVAAAECGNNADNAAALVPALTLGIPGSSVSAVILGGLLVHGLQPGPALFRDSGEIVYGFMLQMLITAALLIVLGGYLGSRVFVKILRLPPLLLVPIVFSLTIVGVYSVNNSMFDVFLLLAFAVVGVFLDRMQYPLAPVVLGVVLGTMAESNLRLALLIGQGEWSALVARPLSIGLATITLLAVMSPILKAIRYRLKARAPVH